MARLKYYDPVSDTWKYADTASGSGGVDVASESATHNILDYTGVTNGMVAWSEAQGIYYDTRNTWAQDRVSSKPLPVEGGATYYLQSFFDGTLVTSGVNSLLELDENMEKVNYTFSSSSIFPYTTQANTRYIIISLTTEGIKHAVLTTTPGNYFVPYVKKTLDQRIYIPAAQVIHPLNGVKWNALGDSWTADGGTNGVYKGYVGRIAERTGMIGRNYGISSSTISTMNDGGYEPMCVRYADMDDDADLVTVMGGINDRTSVVTSIDYGDIDSMDTATFYGGWNVLLSGLRAKYPNAVILVFTNGDCTPQTRGDAEGRVEAIKKVCAKHRIPCCDILHNLGYGYEQYQNDMVHLKPDQIERNLTPLVYNFIMQHYMW